MYDIATAAVEAALAAGARYADARIMEQRSESMTARNGIVETLDRGERNGIGVRALIGASWGFYATPDLSPQAARRVGTLAAEVARASGRVPGPALDLVPGEAAARLVGQRMPRGSVGRAAGREGRPAGERHRAMLDHGVPTSPRRATGSGTPTSGWCPARAPGRPAHRRMRRGAQRHRRRRARDAATQLPGHPRSVRHPRLGARPRVRPGRQRARASPRRPGPLADRARLPGGDAPT